MKILYLLLPSFLKRSGILILFLTLLYPTKSIAQLACGTDRMHQYMQQINPGYKLEIEQLDHEIYDLIKAKENGRYIDDDEVYSIPVVVHIIHKGEAVGVGSNIPDAQIHDAIRGVNERYRRITGDGADMKIEFCLAVQDPNGNTTTGINRINGSIFSGYVSKGVKYGDDSPCSDAAVQEDIQNATRWPREDYYNIWVVHKFCPGDIAGYAYFPTAGDWDGAFMHSDYMTYGAQTLAHELGHAFGLYHTFDGDNDGNSCPTNNDCLQDGDKVCDTPPLKRSECGSEPICSTEGNFADFKYNYLSYCHTYGVTRSRFTEGQKERFRMALKSATRSTLLDSKGCIAPIGDEIKLEGIINTPTRACSEIFSPAIKVANIGTTTITNFRVETKINNVAYPSFNWSGSLSSNGTLDINLPPVNLQEGENKLYIELFEPNENPNDFQGNNFITELISYTTSVVDTIAYDFEDGVFPPVGVDLIDGVTPWSLTTVSCKDKVARINSFNNMGSGFNIEKMILPATDLSGYTDAELKFDVAYKQSYGNTVGILEVTVEEDCQPAQILYSKTREQLATTPGFEYNISWIPLNCDQWRTETINLDNYTGSEITISIVYNTDSEYFAPNIYLDNIFISGNRIPACNPEFISVDTAICSGDLYTLPDGSIVSDAGVYATVLQSTSGCDSTVTVTLTINESPDTTIDVSICANDSYILPDGSVVSDAGTYTTMLQSSAGCDSIVIVHLTVNDVLTTNIDASICPDNSYTLPDGSEVTGAGIYTSILQSSDGCDSTVTVNLTVNETTGCTGANGPCVTPTGFNVLVSGGKVTFTWSGGSFTDIYAIRIVGSHSYAYSEVTQEVIVDNIVPGTYTWYVKSLCDTRTLVTNNASEWIDGGSFTVP